ncbi:hypothetical protein BKH41_04845 [Helicobacter sp. 12S02232-10]|uniref:hypothetical protein n=1 Tax=Helicobacter sp. 12S02232-10 TaxID=1476197 RepID=UPI000BA627E2|nr:hypothetical protein [Helicobacter sp. 12S02232-10]PAF48958.1 hypothetical protein BKH41_04845 [Helicobacter sp. 12S02232-10]
MRKKYFGSMVLLLAASFGSSSAMELKQFGWLAGFYNQGLANTQMSGSKSQSSYAGLQSRIGVNWNMGYGWSSGAAVVAALPVMQSSKAYSKSYYTDSGDFSDLYVRYANEGFKFALGRFMSDEFIASDWIAGPLQGGAIRYTNSFFDVWGTVMDSKLGLGKQLGRYGSELSWLKAYNPTIKEKSMGGEVLSGGFGFKKWGFSIDPYIFYNTNVVLANGLYGNKGLLQAGFNGSYAYSNNSLKAITTLKFMFQNTEARNVALGIHGGLPYNDSINAKSNKDNTFFVLIEEELRYQAFKAGVGYYQIDSGAGIWSVNDKMRFYGKYVNGIGTSNYLARGAYSGYVFLGYDADRIKIDFLYAGGSYNEISLATMYRAYKGKDSALDIGGAYVNSGGSISKNSNALVLFSKLSF